VGDEDKLADWLAAEVCPAELNRDRLRVALLARCRRERIEPPGPSRVERILGAAEALAERRFTARTAGRLTLDMDTHLDLGPPAASQSPATTPPASPWCAQPSRSRRAQTAYHVFFSRGIILGCMDERHRDGGTWTLLTGHGHVLVEIARNAQARIRDIAAAAGLAERTVQAIIADLEAAGHLTRSPGRPPRRLYRPPPPPVPAPRPGRAAHRPVPRAAGDAAGPQAEAPPPAVGPSASAGVS
jgi:hypothetical protein